VELSQNNKDDPDSVKNQKEGYLDEVLGAELYDEDGFKKRPRRNDPGIMLNELR